MGLHQYERLVSSVFIAGRVHGLPWAVGIPRAFRSAISASCRMVTNYISTWDEVMDVVKRAVDAVAARAPRVSVTLKADIRPGVTGALRSKVEAIEERLGS